jgi:hypothetical protein
MDYPKSCLLDKEHVIIDGLAADMTFGNIRTNYLVGILTSNGKLKPMQRAVVLSLNTKTITLKAAGRAAFFKVGDTLTHRAASDGTETSLGLLTAVSLANNTITYAGSGATPAEDDEVYVKDGSETPVGIAMNDLSSTDTTQVYFLDHLLHGIVNSDLIPNYCAAAVTALPHIFFRARGT